MLRKPTLEPKCFLNFNLMTCVGRGMGYTFPCIDISLEVFHKDMGEFIVLINLVYVDQSYFKIQLFRSILLCERDGL